MPNTKNFGYSTVLTAPSPASSGTSLVVQSADGAKFPSTPFNATVWPAGAQALSSNAEIVTVTAISTDTFTIVRGAESSSARSIIVGDQIDASITAGLFPSGSVVGTTDTQTLTNKIVSDTFLGDVYDNQSAIKESVVLTSSTDFIATQGVDVSGSNGLEIPATSSLEISSFYDPASTIPTTKLYNPVKFSVYRAAATTSSSSVTLIPFDTKSYDTGNNADIVTNPGRFIAPFPCFMHFTALAGNTAATATRICTFLYKNGVLAKTGSSVVPASAAVGTFSLVSGDLQLAKGDYVEAFFIGGGGSVMNVGIDACYFEGYLISAT